MRKLSAPEELKSVYRRQGYHLVGGHSAVKTCHWARKSLSTGGREHCYKQRFYGIPSHRCLQMTPSLGRCTQSCLFCWRATPENLGTTWDQTRFPAADAEEPEALVQGQSDHAHPLFAGGRGTVEAQLAEGHQGSGPGGIRPEALRGDQRAVEIEQDDVEGKGGLIHGATEY